NAAVSGSAGDGASIFRLPGQSIHRRGILFQGVTPKVTPPEPNPTGWAQALFIPPSKTFFVPVPEQRLLADVTCLRHTLGYVSEKARCYRPSGTQTKGWRRNAKRDSLRLNEEARKARRKAGLFRGCVTSASRRFDARN